MKNNYIEFEVGQSSVRIIENFTEKICENVFINETYYGNILMCLSEINDLMSTNKVCQALKISYKTDFNVLNLKIDLLNKDNKRDKTDMFHKNSIIESELLLILSDNFEIHNDSICLEFNIGALHNSIYEMRKTYLISYFKTALILES